MPVINVVPKEMQNGDVVTTYTDTVGTTATTYTFLKTQETVILRNKGSKNITYTVGVNTGMLGRSESIVLSGAFDSIVLASEQGTQAFEVWAEEIGNALGVGGADPGLNQRVSDISTKLNQLAANIKDFGAKGDGVADDTSAINTALSTLRHVKVPDGDYKVSTVSIPRGNTLELSKNAKLIASGNNDVVSMHLGATLKGGTIVTNTVSGFTKAAIKLDAVNFPIDDSNSLDVRKQKTIIDDVALQGKLTEGIGIHLYNDQVWRGIDWVAATRITTYGYHKAIFLEAKKPTSNGNWINGNVFDDITMLYPVYGIYTSSTSVFDVNNAGVVCSNYFTNLMAQWGNASLRMVYCDGGLNVFEGVAFDFPVEFEFTDQSRLNRIETIFGNGFDSGYKNRVITPGNFPTKSSIPLNHVNNATFAGVQDDFLAYADKRFTVTQKSGPAPSSGSLSNVFSYPPAVGVPEFLRRESTVVYSNTKSNPVVIQIDFPYPVNYLEMISIQFLWGAPKNVKIEAFSDAYQWMNISPNDWVQTNNRNEVVAAVPNNLPLMNIKSLRFTVSHDTNFELNRISAFSSHYAGATYLQRGGGKLFGTLDLGGNPLINPTSITFNQITAASAPNSSMFTDSADGKLKYKNTSGVITVLTP